MNQSILYKPLCIPVGEDFRVVPPQDIAYVESNGHFCRVYRISTGGFLVAPVAITEISRVLPGSVFCQIHRRYIVYLPEVKSFNRSGTRVCMAGGAWLPVSRSYKSSLYANFCLLRLT